MLECNWSLDKILFIFLSFLFRLSKRYPLFTVEPVYFNDRRYNLNLKNLGKNVPCFARLWKYCVQFTFIVLYGTILKDSERCMCVWVIYLTEYSAYWSERDVLYTIQYSGSMIILYSSKTWWSTYSFFLFELIIFTTLTVQWNVENH